jgi:malate permease and related proteins
MQQIILIAVCIGIGVLLRWSGQLPETAGKTMGAWVVSVALPAAVLQNVNGIKLVHAPYWWLAAVTPWIGAILAIIVIGPLCAALGWSRERCGALILVAGWGNTSFVGLPMIAAFAGQKWIGLGIAIDLFGSYLALSTLGLAVASVASSRRFDWRLMLKRIVTFPPLIAVLVALATNRIERPEWFTQILEALAGTLTPLALATVGFMLPFERRPGRLAPLAAGIGFRLVVAPLAILVLFYLFPETGDPAARVAILEMAMPPMLAATILALDHDLEPELVALLNGVGIPLSMLTAAGWWSLSGSFRTFFP